MKMCSISVEPIPSTMSTPKWRLKRSPISAGSASPADDHQPQRHRFAAGQRGRCQHACESGGGAEEHGRPDTADAAAQAL